METENNSNPKEVATPKLIYRCKKCRRIVATDESIVPHERGKGEKCFRRKGRNGHNHGDDQEPVQCNSIFVEPLMWMQPVQEGYLGEKLHCIGCKARLGFFNWVGMQCNCGAWVNPAFMLHKSRLDECHV